MRREFKLALSVSVGLHAAAFVSLPVTEPVAFDVERGPASVELYLVAPRPAPPPPTPLHEAPPDAPTPQPEPIRHAMPQPVADTAISQEQKGAVTELLPGYLRNPPPVYPTRAREGGYAGTVLLEVEVLPSGRCGTINVLASSSYALLDQAALSAVRGWVFKPARRGQQPVTFWVEIPITFRLTPLDIGTDGTVPAISASP